MERSPATLRKIVTGLVIGIFLAALESTVVATAMPRVIRELGGERYFALPFAVFLLVMTVSSPVWGRLSDLYGRRHLYLGGALLFLLGSILCGAAPGIGWLIASRALQGLGAGSVTTLTFILIGELYPPERRARIQGAISTVWGLSGMLGPLVGGLIVDHASWRWVFYLNIPFALIAMFLISRYLKEDQPHRRERLDLPGAILFTLGSGLLIWGFERENLLWAGLGALLFAVALGVEWRHPNPLVPLRVLTPPMPRTAILCNLLAGAAYFGSITYIPAFAQGVSGASATDAGIILTPMVVGWTGSSLVGAKLLNRLGIRTLSLLGFTLLVFGFLGFVLLVHAPLPFLGATGFVVGCGMGYGMLALLIALQESVDKRELGASTAALLFARNMGGVIGVAAMHPLIGSLTEQTKEALAGGLQRAFFLGLGLAILSLGMVVWHRKALRMP